jgi:hypothetical protein
MGVEGVMTNMTTGVVGTDATAPTASDVLASQGPPSAAPEAAVEPAVEAKPAVDKVSQERASTRFAALARKEAEVFRKSQAIRQQQAELARQAEELKAFQAARQQAKLNPLDALKQLGLTYDELTEFVLNDNKPTPSAEVQSVRQEIEEFKRQAAEERRRAEEQQKSMLLEEQQRVVEAFREEVNDYVSQHSETYELTALYGGANLVSEVIEEHFRQSGKLMSIPEAAKLTEEYYEDLARKAQATKKFAATQQKATPPQVSSQGTVPKLGPTLTNDLTVTAAARAQSPRTDAERIAAAMARLEGR